MASFFSFLLGHCVPSPSCWESGKLVLPMAPVSGQGMAPREGHSGPELLGGSPWLQVPGHGLVNLRCSSGVVAKPPRALPLLLWGLALGGHWPSGGSLPMVTRSQEVFPAPCPCAKELPAPEES